MAAFHGILCHRRSRRAMLGWSKTKRSATIQLSLPRTMITAKASIQTGGKNTFEVEIDAELGLASSLAKVKTTAHRTFAA